MKNPTLRVLLLPILLGVTVVGATPLAKQCLICHSTVKSGTLAKPGTIEIPSLSGMTSAEIADKMANFKADNSHATIMTRIAKGYSPQEIHALSEYFGD